MQCFSVLWILWKLSFRDTEKGKKFIKNMYHSSCEKEYRKSMESF